MDEIMHKDDDHKMGLFTSMILNVFGHRTIGMDTNYLDRLTNIMHAKLRGCLVFHDIGVETRAYIWVKY